MHPIHNIHTLHPQKNHQTPPQPTPPLKITPAPQNKIANPQTHEIQHHKHLTIKTKIKPTFIRRNTNLQQNIRYCWLSNVQD